MKKQENHFEKLQEAFNEYFNILMNGCGDPTWEDGANINLCANHFHYHKERIKEKYPEKKWACLEWIYENLLVEVPYDYMARKDEIKAGAKKAVAEFEADTNLSYIRQTMGLLSKEQRGEVCAEAVLGYCTNLRLAIEEDDFVTMRRYENNTKTYLAAFLHCAGKMRKIDLGLFGGCNAP